MARSSVSESFALSSVLVLVLACGAEPSPDANECASLAPHVTAGTVPTFSWAPAHCAVSLLTVAHDAGGTQVVDWLVEGHGNSIEPTVDYGTRPPGATPVCELYCPFLPPAPLQTGQSYRLRLTEERIDQHGDFFVGEVGAVDFQP